MTSYQQLLLADNDGQSTQCHYTHVYLSGLVGRNVVKGKGKGNCIAVMEHHVTATECHTVLPATRHK